MNPTRKFRPLAQDALEDRIAPSQIAVGVHNPPAQVRAGAAAAKGHARVTFAANIADTIAAGLPVKEQRTIRFGGGSTQTETQLIQPDNANSTTLTTKTITLPKNGGTESYTDFSYVTVSGLTVHDVSLYLPDGSLQTETRTVETMGSTRRFSASVKLPNNGGVRRITGTSVDSGPVTITDQTVAQPDGSVEHDHIVVVHHGELRETETETKTLPDGKRQVTRSTTTVVRLQPPTPYSAGTTAPGAAASPPKLA